MSLGRRFTEKRAITPQDVYGKDLIGFGSGTKAGVAVTQDNALRLTAVWACVTLIADDVSKLPIDLYRKPRGKRAELVEPGPKWLTNPNSEMTRFEFFNRNMVGQLMDGNAFVFNVFDGDRIVERIPLHPYQVQVVRDETGRKLFVINGDSSKLYTEESVLHVPAFCKPGDLRGMSPIEAAREAIGLAQAAQDYGANFYSKGSTLSGVIQSPAEMSTEQAKVMARTFMASHQGVEKAHAVGVLTGGAQWMPITIPPDQAQFLETRKFQLSEIARLYRVPPHKIGDVERSTSWGTGLEEQERGYVSATLSPWLVRWEQALTRAYCLPNEYVKFNLDALLRGKTKERYEAYAIGRQWGWLSSDDIRAQEDMEALPNGEGSEYLRPLNMVPAGTSPELVKPKADTESDNAD